MKVVCIKKYKSMGFQHQLTFGKTYNIIGWTPNKMAVYIINDRGRESIYSITDFVYQDEWRDMKIKALGI